MIAPYYIYCFFVVDVVMLAYYIAESLRTRRYSRGIVVVKAQGLTTNGQRKQ